MTQATSTIQLGAIATPHATATEIGAQVMREGGNAIDAAIAAAVALCVVYPNNVALGSDLVALVRTPDGAVHEINATGQAPRALTLDNLRETHGASLPMYGVDTINVPAAIRGLETMLKLGGHKSWHDLVSPSISLAELGIPMPSSVSNGLQNLRNEIMQDEGCRGVFVRDGDLIREGEPFVQPALAKTLTRLAHNGADEFYAGETARTWVAGLNKLGCAITLDDLMSCTAEVKEPLELTVNGLTVHSSCPNTQGFVLLRALKEVLGDDLDRGTPEVSERALARAFQGANAVRDQFLSDERYGGQTGYDLMAMPVPEHVDAVFKGRPMGDTVGIAVSSADGYSVSLIQSVYFQFGSAVLEPETGILFQNRGTSFSLDPQVANVFEPGKRPSHTLMPALVSDSNGGEYVLATMGGQGQPQILAQLLQVAMRGGSAEEAVSTPRWLVGRQAPEDSPDTVTYEEDVASDVIRELEAEGFTVKEVSKQSDKLGHANMIDVRDGHRFEAASDPRSDGAAIVVA